MVQVEVVPFPSAEDRERVRIDDQARMQMGRDMARAMADAGYMSLERYVELYGPHRPCSVPEST